MIRGFRHIVIASMLMLAMPLLGQLLHPDEPRPSFEVATVKQFDPKGMIRVSVNGSQQVVRTVGTARRLVAQAYNVRGSAEGRISATAPWIDGQIYMVEAKISDEVFAHLQQITPAERSQQVQLMLQSLLAERFQLKVHLGMRDMPVYELVEDKGGAKLPPPNAPPIAADGGWAMSPKGEMRIHNLRLDELLESPFFGLGDRPIVNRSGLTGNYNFTLNWKPTQPTAPGGYAAAADDAETSIFTALREQLGLKLVPSRGMVEVIYIDQVERPSEN